MSAIDLGTVGYDSIYGYGRLDAMAALQWLRQKIPDTDHDGVEDRLDLDDNDDGLNDSIEISIGTNPLNPDTDNDALTDLEEIVLGTDPNNPDTDNDGTDDGAEVHQGSDPTVNIPAAIIPVSTAALRTLTVERQSSELAEGGRTHGVARGGAELDEARDAVRRTLVGNEPESDETSFDHVEYLDVETVSRHGARSLAFAIRRLVHAGQRVAVPLQYQAMLRGAVRKID